MNICGLIKTSLIDYPGKISSILFLGGCNLRCKYCHNPSLAVNDASLTRYSLNEIKAFLTKRKNIIDGVTVSGGEPTTRPRLKELLQEIRNLKLLIKLDTNGMYPEVIRDIIAADLVDYISIDVKTSADKFNDLTNSNSSFEKIIETVSIIKENNIDYELRTTCLPEYVTLEDLKKIRHSFGHTKRYYLQQFTNDTDMLDAEMRKTEPYSQEVLYDFKDFVDTFTDECYIRL